MNQWQRVTTCQAWGRVRPRTSSCRLSIGRRRPLQISQANWPRRWTLVSSWPHSLVQQHTPCRPASTSCFSRTCLARWCLRSHLSRRSLNVTDSNYARFAPSCIVSTSHSLGGVRSVLLWATNTCGSFFSSPLCQSAQAHLAPGQVRWLARAATKPASYIQDGGTSSVRVNSMCSTAALHLLRFSG